MHILQLRVALLGYLSLLCFSFRTADLRCGFMRGHHHCRENLLESRTLTQSLGLQAPVKEARQEEEHGITQGAVTQHRAAEGSARPSSFIQQIEGC